MGNAERGFARVREHPLIIVLGFMMSTAIITWQALDYLSIQPKVQEIERLRYRVAVLEAKVDRENVTKSQSQNNQVMRKATMSTNKNKQLTQKVGANDSSSKEPLFIEVDWD